ncbi:MAG: Hpt domain-containing protein [Thaumarchaeota archaeon]|nr:Hpt domain-containing protein [Nitrososphaerota archaeon]
MSDEFIKIATQEINDELSSISTILGLCQNDNDVSKNSDKIEKHIHKIKGLAPMMGKENIGNLAKTLDFILKKIASGQKVDGFFEPLSISTEQMKITMDKPHDLGEVHKQISDIASKIVD